MPIDPHSDVPYDELIDFYTHIDRKSDYYRRYAEAASVTSPDDRRRNQSIKYARQSLLYQCAVSALPLDGDFAECGCFHGQSAYMLAGMIRDCGSPAAMHVFDSFQGLSPFTPEDSAGLNRTEEREAAMRAQFMWPVEKFMEAMAPFEDRLHVYPGWIPERFHEVADRRFALVHIDVDLYQPTRDSLEFFFPLMVEGGWLVDDDYNSRPYPGANKAVDDFVAEVKPKAAIAGQVGGFVICC